MSSIVLWTAIYWSARKRPELIVWRARRNGDEKTNLGNSYFRDQEGKTIGRALTKWRRNGAHAQARKNRFLQKSLRPEPSHRIDYCLPLKNPAGHRKAKCRIEQMHLSHSHPPIGLDLVDPQGRKPTSTTSIGTIATAMNADKAHTCYGSGTEVIRGNSKYQQAGKEPTGAGLPSLVNVASFFSARRSVRLWPGLPEAPLPSTGCLPPSVSETRPDRGAASLPTVRSVPRSAASASRIAAVRPR